MAKTVLDSLITMVDDCLAYFPPLVQRFVCGGDCFWHMPTKEQIECDLTTTEPPIQQTEFIGTFAEALADGWRLAPREKRFWWRGIYFPLYLCPVCVEKGEKG